MISKWAWLWHLLSRRLWFRASMISLLAVAAAILSLILSPYLPFGLSTSVGADAVDHILNIIASSMLAVTIFSLSTMVTTYATATANVTPRAIRLLIEDSTTQNVLATFVGSFIYSVMGIITLSMGAYGERGRVVLFAMTLIVIALIVVTLLHWIDYLLRLGRVGETTNAVEEVTMQAMRRRREKPCLGGQALADPEKGIPDGAQPVFPDRVGYVQHLDTAGLAATARERNGAVYVAALPGAFVDTNRPMAWCSGFDDTEGMEAVRDAFTVADERSFDQDPRFGVSVLTEIASRALSPATNDMGTAIDVIGRQVRVLSIWADTVNPEEPLYPEIWVPEVKVEDLFDDAFDPIARDGAAIPEVQMRLHKAFAALGRIDDPRYAESALRHSALALARAEATIGFEPDRQRIRQAAALVRA
ncbi:DUF2254 domain-containing protein [Mesorhizobium sp. CN5-321]|jgi:uncharacterized membrane protein|uniref:DUF2254 domain-containing protein n=1 Tax=Mesorhizobium hunchu TaxID=3157708 RepID=UPI0032B7C0DA